MSLDVSIKNKIAIRSKALAKTRHFFSSRDFLEVDIRTLNKEASVDAYIDLFEIPSYGFLHSSPELRMKDLLTKNSGNIYFLGHVFRKEEEGTKHSSEFTMLEYYRINTNEKKFLQEAVQYLSIFLGNHPTEILTYQSALEKYSPKDLPPEVSNYSSQEKGHYIFSHYVEPNIGKNAYTIITNFPSDEASLAQTKVEKGIEVAKRYEIFHQGVELANGFYELSCATTARQRFQEANKLRSELGKNCYPIDKTFLHHLDDGLPENTYGIAIGFDRMLMLAHKRSCIKDVIL